MDTRDNRERFKGVRWQQGRLLITPTTERWDRDRQHEADYLEKCMAFAYFTPADAGCGREYVFRYGSPAECKAAVEWHNEMLGGF